MSEEKSQVNPDYVDAPYEASGFIRVDGKLLWFHDREIAEIDSGKVIERRNQDTGELIEKYILPTAIVLRETERDARSVRFYKDKRRKRLANAREWNPDTQAFDKLPNALKRI